MLNFACLIILYCLNPTGDIYIPFCVRKKKIIYLLSCMKDSHICSPQGVGFERVLVSILLSEIKKYFQGVSLL